MEQCEYCGHPLRFRDSQGRCVVQMGDPDDVAKGIEKRCWCPPEHHTSAALSAALRER